MIISFYDAFWSVFPKLEVFIDPAFWGALLGFMVFMICFMLLAIGILFGVFLLRNNIHLSRIIRRPLWK